MPRPDEPSRGFWRGAYLSVGSGIVAATLLFLVDPFFTRQGKWATPVEILLFFFILQIAKRFGRRLVGISDSQTSDQELMGNLAVLMAGGFSLFVMALAAKVAIPHLTDLCWDGSPVVLFSTFIGASFLVPFAISFIVFGKMTRRIAKMPLAQARRAFWMFSGVSLGLGLVALWILQGIVSSLHGA